MPLIIESSQATLTKQLTEEVVAACLEVRSQVDEDAKGRDFHAPVPVANVNSRHRSTVPKIDSFPVALVQCDSNFEFILFILYAWSC